MAREGVCLLSKVTVLRTDLVELLPREWGLDTRDFLRRRMLRSASSLVVKAFRYSRVYAMWEAKGTNNETQWIINKVAHAENAS